LQAAQLYTPMTFLQSAKLLKVSDQTQRALQEVDNALAGNLPDVIARAVAKAKAGNYVPTPEDCALAKVGSFSLPISFV
jgi:hypothetical protein